MGINKIKGIFTIVLIYCLLFSLPSLAFGGLSKEQEEKLNELIETSKPTVSIFGKIDKPLKAGVSIYQNSPGTIDLEVIDNPAVAIKLPGKRGEDLAGLEARRKELQEIEEEGLNFIQPSLELTEPEQKAIDEFFSRNEQEQLLNLWKATIERNKTIQFIVQKLTPAESTQQANSILSKTLGAAIFLPFYTLQALSDNAGFFYGSQVGGRVLGSVLEGKMKKSHAEIQLSQTEAIILFMMIDEVAERLRQRYHAFKGLMVERALATSELEEAKKDSLDAHDTDSQGAKVVSDIQRRSIEREIRRIDAQVRSHRNALVELAGPQAVGELDQQLRLELAASRNTPLDFLDVGQ